MADHTDDVLKVVKAVVDAIKAVDLDIDVAATVRSVTLTCIETGAFNIDVVSTADVDQSRYELGIQQILKGDCDGP